MAKFKVGDKVRIVSDNFMYGAVFEVQDVFETGDFQYVWGKHGAFSFCNVELAGPYGKHHMTAREICGGCE